MCLYILLVDQDEGERTKGKDKSLCKDCIIALVRIFSTMLNKSGQTGYPCLVPDLWRKF